MCIYLLNSLGYLNRALMNFALDIISGPPSINKDCLVLYFVVISLHLNYTLFFSVILLYVDRITIAVYRKRDSKSL